MTQLPYTHISFIHAEKFGVTIQNNEVLISNKEQTIALYQYIYDYQNGTIELTIGDNLNNCNKHNTEIRISSSSVVLIALDALFNCFSNTHIIYLLHRQQDTDWLRSNNQLHCYLDTIWIINNEVHHDLFYQQQNLWLNQPITSSYPTRYITHNSCYHPQRPKIKNNAPVYQRYIPWLETTLSFRLFDLEKDLDIFHKWMNDPEINFFWEESGTIEEHEQFITKRLNPNSVSTPLIACFDGHPFGYFETYWAKEDRIAIYYPVENFDRGWHVLIGDKNYRGKDFVTAWMPSISHYLFLDDSRTQRIVIEPRIDNHKMIKSLNKCGYAHMKTFNFPHKRAMLGVLEREHFFSSLGFLPKTTPSTT